MAPFNREQAVAEFRARLLQLIESSDESRSAFAARVGMDRSTLSQLLAAENDRLPRVETVIAIATTAQVSCDWLLGMVQEQDQQNTELVRADMEIEAGAGSPMDERLARWHEDASGYKIRYIPTTLPDLLKTEAVIQYECPDIDHVLPLASVEQTSQQLRYSRHPDTEMEVCCARETLGAFARGEGIWRNLATVARREQIQHMIQLTAELYPTFRWSLYDGLRHFSVPITVFGPQRAVVYMGDLYFVFNTTEHIRVLMAHFDGLVKAAEIQPTDMTEHLQQLLQVVA